MFDLQFKLNVEDFEGIESASINMRGLTMFVGENGTGKTSLLRLLYGVMCMLNSYVPDSSDLAEGSDVVFGAAEYARLEEGINKYIQQCIPEVLIKYIPGAKLGRIYCQIVRPSEAVVAKFNPDTKKYTFNVTGKEVDSLADVRRYFVHGMLFNDMAAKPAYIPAGREFFVDMHLSPEDLDAGVHADYLSFMRNDDLSELSDAQKYIKSIGYREESVDRLSVKLSPFFKAADPTNKCSLVVCDAPEEGLHPSVVAKLAHYFSRLIKQGTSALLQTHSSLFAYTINNLAILNKVSDTNRLKFVQENEMDCSDLIDCGLVNAYLFHKVEDKIVVDTIDCAGSAGNGFVFTEFDAAYETHHRTCSQLIHLVDTTDDEVYMHSLFH